MSEIDKANNLANTGVKKDGSAKKGGRKRIGDEVLTSTQRARRTIDKIKKNGGLIGSFTIRDRLTADAVRTLAKKKFGGSVKKTADYLIVKAINDLATKEI